MEKYEEKGLVIGNWYRQYSAGYWKLLETMPKYATHDFRDGIGGPLRKKGDRLGEWVILKKGFTAKMKKCKVFSECIDAGWLTPVSDEIAEELELKLAADSKHKAQFETETEMRIGAFNRFMKLSPEQAMDMEHKLSILPERFTETEWKNIVQLPAECIDVPRIVDANYLLNLFENPWEITEDYDQIYCGWQLVPFNETI